MALNRLDTREESTNRQEARNAEKIRRQNNGERSIQNGDTNRQFPGGQREGKNDGGGGNSSNNGGGSNGANSGPPGPGGVYQSPTLGVHLNKLASIFEKTPAYADIQWLTSTLGKNISSALSWFDAQINYLKNIKLGDIKGGAMALIDMIKGGKWDEIGQATQEAPDVAKASGALAIGGVILLGVTGLSAGAAVAGGVLGKVAGSGVGKWIMGALGVGGVSIANNWQTIFRTGEQAVNFDWGQSDKALFGKIKSAIERLYEPMGGALGKACASVLVGRSTGTMRININVRTLAMATLIGTPDQSPAEDAMAEALAEMCGVLRRIGGQILGMLSFMGGRKIAGYITGNNWGDDENASFVPAKKLGEIKDQILQPLDIDERVSDALEEFGEEFYDTLKELMTDDDTWVNFVRA